MARWAGTTTQRGLGGQHQALRRQKLAILVDGTPCRRCGHPRYHPARCPHGPCWLCTLDLGHHTDRVLGGQGPRELEHSFLQPIGWREAVEQPQAATSALAQLVNP